MSDFPSAQDTHRDEQVLSYSKSQGGSDMEAAGMGMSTAAAAHEYEGADNNERGVPPPRLFGWKEGLIGLSVILTLIVGSVILIILSLQVRLYKENGYALGNPPMAAYTLILPPGGPLGPPGRPGPHGPHGPPPFRLNELGAVNGEIAGSGGPVVPLDKLLSLPHDAARLVENIVIPDFMGGGDVFSVLGRRHMGDKLILTLNDGYRLIVTKHKAQLEKRERGPENGKNGKNGNFRPVKVLSFPPDDPLVNTASRSGEMDVAEDSDAAPARRLGAGIDMLSATRGAGLVEMGAESASYRALGKEDDKALKGLTRGLGRGKKGRGVSTPPPEVIRTAETGGPPTSFMDAYCRYGCGGMAVTFPYYYRPFFGYGYPLVGTQQSFPAGYGGYAGAPLLAAQAGNTGMAGQALPINAGAYSAAPMQAAPVPNPYAQQPVYTGPGVGAPVAP